MGYVLVDSLGLRPVAEPGQAMLTYTYECKRCGEFEHEQRISDPRLERCPSCKSPVRRLIDGGQGFITKGGGGSFKGDGCSHSGSCASCGSGCASCGH